MPFCENRTRVISQQAGPEEAHGCLTSFAGLVSGPSTLFLLLLTKTWKLYSILFLNWVCGRGVVLSLGSQQAFLLLLNISALARSCPRMTALLARGRERAPSLGSLREAGAAPRGPAALPRPGERALLAPRARGRGPWGTR